MRMLVIAAVLAMLGCAAPLPQGQGPQQTADRDTTYSIEDRPDGFLISVAYSRYQFIPESGAVATACKQALTATAYDVAEKRGKRIDPVNEQRIKLSMGRNGFTGITSCEASAPVNWTR